MGVSLKKNMTGCRIAVVGDSYTFGQHVAYDRTWVHLLEEGLDSKCQVLNFGVGGYGVDQMYLRYQKDIRSWSPDIVVLAFIEDDATRRSLAVYSFLLFPDGTMPFVKPRFALRNGELNVVNYPLASSDEVFATPSIHELPFIEYDYNYRATEWNRAAWRYLNGSYAFRLLLSLHPPYEPERPEISREEAKAINRELFLRFTENVRADGALPVVVHLPTDMDFPIPPGAPLSLQILRDANIPHLDLRRCLSERDPADIFRPIEKGGHYSEEGNRQVAQCLLDPIRAQLDARAVRNRGHSPPIRMVVP